MKIAFESQLLLKGNKTGIGWCADNLIREFLKDSQYDCRLDFFSKGCNPEKLAQLTDYRKAGAALNSCTSFRAVWYKLIWPFLPLPYSCFFGDDAQITQFFNYVIPPGVKGKKVTIVHDMAHLACRETVRLKTRRWLDLTLKQSCKRADLIITVSAFSKEEIKRYFKIPENKIKVMYPGVNLELYTTGYSQEMIEEAKIKYSISGNYFLYLGTIEPRKNIQRILEAYVQLRDTVAHIPQLVLAGGRGWLCDSIYENAKKLNRDGDIIFTGYIEEQDSPLLFAGATAFLFPSLYEGFGTPPIEAMACGTPVISSNIASMPEVIGDAGLLVNPYSVEEIKCAMEKMIYDNQLREKLIEKGLDRANRYTWKNSANTLKNLYEDLLK